MVHIAGSPNEEVAPKRRTKFFEYGLAKLRLSDGLYLVLGMVGVGVNLRLYYDQHVVAKLKANSEVTSLQGQPRIGEFAFDEIYDNRFRLIMQGVDLYFLQKGGHVAYNRKNASSVLASWLSGKNDIVLVTGRSSYEKCGAKSFFSPLLHGKRVTHLTTAGENARAEDVAEKRRQIPSKVDGYIAIGGGTVIDTTKLIRGLEGDLPPFLAVPTTAGTGDVELLREVADALVRAAVADEGRGDEPVARARLVRTCAPRSPCTGGSTGGSACTTCPCRSSCRRRACACTPRTTCTSSSSP